MQPKDKNIVIVDKELNKSNYMVTVTSTYTKTENWLVENETKEDAKYIAENQNQSPLYKCTLWSEEESGSDYDEAIVKEVSFEKTEDGKHFDWKKIGEKNEQ
jgi:hypothetical protein|tara:strand:+ start:632 stop:937 length:306 start_codon:yes stop_codon:yes gene_type:complete